MALQVSVTTYDIRDPFKVYSGNSMAGTAAHLLADHDEGGCVLGRHQALSTAECHVHRI